MFIMYLCVFCVWGQKKLKLTVSTVNSFQININRLYLVNWGKLLDLVVCLDGLWIASDSYQT